MNQIVANGSNLSGLPLQPSIYICAVEGGGNLAIGPMLFLDHLARLTRMHATDSFQVFDAVSSSGITLSAVVQRDRDNPSRPRFTEQDIIQRFEENASVICPDQPDGAFNLPSRILKLAAINVGYALHDLCDPLQSEADALAVAEMPSLFENLRRMAHEWGDDRTTRVLQKMEGVVTGRWLSPTSRQRAMGDCLKLLGPNGEMVDDADRLRGLIGNRYAPGRLTRAFLRGVRGGMRGLITWGQDCMLDPAIREGIFQGVYGDARLSDGLRSIVITAGDIRLGGEAMILACLKDDVFDSNPDTPAEHLGGNPTFTDAVMATTANLMAFIPHIMPRHMVAVPNDRVAVDMATLHTPAFCYRAVKDRNPGATVRLVHFGTGRREVRPCSAEEAQRRGSRYGLAGGAMRGEMLSQAKKFNMSNMRHLVGADNLIEIAPRITAERVDEIGRMPGHEFDASPANLARIRDAAQREIAAQDQQFRNLAYDLTVNAFVAGTMPEEKFRDVCHDLGRVAPLHRVTGEPVSPRATRISVGWEKAASAMSWFRGRRQVPPIVAAAQRQPTVT